MRKRSRPAPAARRAYAWTLGWLASAALYLLLIDIITVPELVTGAVATALAATGLELAREQRIVGESIRVGWLVRLYRPLVSVPRDIGLVSLALLDQLAHRRRRRGVFRAVPFSAVGDAPLSGGRRALAEALGSFAPNTIIIGV